MSVPRRSAGRALIAGLVCAVLSCGGDGDGTQTSLDASPGPDSEGDGPPHPSFSEPASGRLSLPTTRTDDLTLRVVGVVPGVTELVLDGHGLGPLDEGATLGRLDADALRLRMRGSMISGQHRMSLRTSDASGSDESEMIVVTIVAEGVPPPAATLDPTPTLAGDRVLGGGDDHDPLLLAVELADEGPRLHLLPRTDDAWDATAARTLALPGLAIGPGERALPVSALRYGHTDDDPGRVRVAWRVGSPGTSIAVIDTPWETASPEAAARTSMTLDDARADRPAEWAEFGRPWLLPGLLLVELWAPLDVESPRPGDRALVFARVHDDARGLDPAQRVRTGSDLVDLDRLGPAIDAVATASGRPAPWSSRVDQLEPALVELDPDGAVLRLRPSAVEASSPTLSAIDLPLATVVGAIGSRTIMGLAAHEGGTVHVRFDDDLGDGGAEVTSLDADDLPDPGLVSAEVAPASIDGVTVFVVPFGPDHDVQAIYGVGVVAKVVPLPLRCDAVAVAGGANLGAAPLACSLDGEVRLGTLHTLEP